MSEKLWRVIAMEIGGFKVGDYVVREEGNKRHLIFDCRNCVYGTSIADDHACRFHVVSVLGEVEADLIVLADVYERVYDEVQTKMLAEVASLRQKFNIESIWSYKNLGAADKECEKYFSARHDLVVKIAHDLIAVDPILAYLTLLKELKMENRKMLESDQGYKKCTAHFVKTLEHIKNGFENTSMINETKDFLAKMGSIPETNKIYRSLFEVEVKPSFIGSRLLFKEME